MSKNDRRRAAAPVAAEDEMLRLRNQALAEEEEAKRKAELVSHFLKDKLAKEKQNSAMNLHKINVHWRGVLRENKAKMLRQDIEILSLTFARVMNCKDSAIQSLVTDLEEAEEQHAQTLRSHLYNIDRLLQLQRCRLTHLQEGYEAQLEALKKEFEVERTTILEQQEQEMRFLQDMALTTEQNYARNEQEATQNFQGAQADIKNKSVWDEHYSRRQLCNKAEVLWEQLQKAARSHAEAIEHQKVAFEVLKQKEKKSSREIRVQAKKLQKLQDLVTATKGQLVAHRRESEVYKRRAREEKEKALRQLQELESRMSLVRTKARGDLVRLTTQSNAALKVLLKVVKKAQRILRLDKLCRRLEVEEEKMLPFYPSSLDDGEQQNAQQVLQEMPVEPLAQALQDYVELERFWERLNKAKMEEQVLEREGMRLRERNQQLREMLKQYLDRISVNQELVEINPLLTVEAKSCIPQALPCIRGDCA